MKDMANIEEDEEIFKEIDLNYKNEFFNNGFGMDCKRIAHCSCDCDRCGLNIFIA